MSRQAPSPVTAVAAAPAAEAGAHFRARLAVETDADDVAAAIAECQQDFVLVDTRSPEAYEAAHLPGAISLPHRAIDAGTAASLPPGLVVVYCWGPGCNGAAKAAVRFAQAGRSVKEMLGGFEYWVREGHPLEGEAVDGGRYRADASGLVCLPPPAGARDRSGPAAGQGGG